MQNVKEERWRPGAIPSTPSSRLRAARSMPPWLQARGTAVPPPPPPPIAPPPADPDYEVIEFHAQQAYSNAPPPRPAPPGKPRGDAQRCDLQRCDLCGSSAPAVRCEQCSQQNFCMSCDEMYHRHPKRQTHHRKPLDTARAPTLRPPLPPKGESNSAPVPPPRRHKRSGRTTPVSPDQGLSNKMPSNTGVMGSLKRMMGTRPLPPAPPLARDPRLSASNSPLTFTEFSDHQPPSRDSGYLDWELDSRHRSGSLTTLNAPGFGPLMHAQSMATLNCPSCHHHGLIWDWNQSHMTAGVVPGHPWGGMSTGTWHGSAMLPPYRPERPEDALRRNSLRVPPRRNRRDFTTDDEDDLHHKRNMSPARSRRGPISDDSEDEVMSHRGSRRHRRRNSPVSRNVSPALSRRSSRKKSSVGVEELIARRVKQNEEEALRSSRRFDDETMSNRGTGRYDDETTSIRGSHRYDDETMSNRGGRRYEEDKLSIKSGRRHDFDDSMSSRSQKLDDDIISNKGKKRYDADETLSNRGGRRVSDRRRRHSPKSPGLPRRYPRNTSSEDSGDEMSDSIKHNTSLTKQSVQGITNLIAEKQEEVNIPSDVDKPLGPIPDQEWECDHCTFVNQAGTRVCVVCCKTTINPKYKEIKQQPSPQTSKSEKLKGEKHSQVRRQDSSTSPIKENLQTRETKVQQGSKEEVNAKTSMKQQPVKQNDQADADLAEKMKQLVISPTTASSDKKKENEKESQKQGTKISKGTSPPPQSISTQTYDVLPKPQLKRATSLVDQELWSSPNRNLSSRHSVTSDSQLSRRSGSQPPEYLSTLVQKQVKQGMEMVKLLREAEEQQFSADDLSVALAQCGDGDPVAWLRDNWRNMIDTVVTLATNYGHERKENTIGTISVAEAREALRMHSGNVWAAVTECVDQRQKKYAELMSRGNFTREDIVTVLTANHGNLEAAYLELNKSQLKPFLMRIWGPPQGTDNDSANVIQPQHQDDRVYMEGQGQGLGRELGEEVSDHNFYRIKSWLDTYVHQSIEAHEAKLNNSNQLHKLSSSNEPKHTQSTLVDSPPEIPPRRKVSRIDDSVEGDYENILIGESNLSTANQKPENRSNYDQREPVVLGMVKADETSTSYSDKDLKINNKLAGENYASENLQFKTSNLIFTTSMEDNRIKDSENKQPQKEFYGENNKTLNQSKDLDDNSEKQIIVEKLIVNGKVQEVRKYVLNKAETDNLMKNTVPVQQIHSKSLFLEEVNSKLAPKQEVPLSLDSDTVEYVQDPPLDSLSHEISSSVDLMTKTHIPPRYTDLRLAESEDLTKASFKSNSTSYESLCYSEGAHDVDEPNAKTSKSEIVTSAKLLVSVDQHILNLTNSNSKSSADTSKDKENKPNHSQKEFKTVKTDPQEIKEPNVSSQKRSTVNISYSSNITSLTGIPSESIKHIDKNESNRSLVDQKLGEEDDTNAVFNSSDAETNIIVQENSGRNITSKETNTQLPTVLSVREVFVERVSPESKTAVGFERDDSVSPSASEIIADSTRNSRNVSSESEDFEEIIEEYEEETSSDEEVKHISQCESVTPTAAPEQDTRGKEIHDSRENISLSEPQTSAQVLKDIHNPEGSSDISNKTHSSPPAVPDNLSKQEAALSLVLELSNDRTTNDKTANKFEPENTVSLQRKQGSEDNIPFKEIPNEMDKKTITASSPSINENNNEIFQHSNKTKSLQVTETSSYLLETQSDNSFKPDIIVSKSENSNHEEINASPSQKLDSLFETQESLNNRSTVNISTTPDSLKTNSLSITSSENRSSSSPSEHILNDTGNTTNIQNDDNARTKIAFNNVEGVNMIQEIPHSSFENKDEDSSLETKDSKNSKRQNEKNEEITKPKSAESDSVSSRLSITTNSDLSHISTPSLMPEYILNEALNPITSEEDIQSSGGQKSTRGSSDKSQTSERSLSMIESRAEILELLKESLSSDLVLDRIVSTLFASVLNHTDSDEITNPGGNDELIPPDSDLKRFQTFSSSDSEIKTESDFFEAQDEVEVEDVDRRLINSEDDEELFKKDKVLKTEIIVDNVEKEENLSTEQQYVIESERQVRQYLAEGIVSTYDQAELVVKLMELNFEKEASISAATECSSLQSALTYLQQDCQLCTGKYPMNQMISMLECEHRCCRDCALHYFTLQITERSINDCVCPFCKLPELHTINPDQALDYFSNLDILLKGLLEETIHELFQRKLRDRTLMQDPHFKWCVKCSSGFIANPRQKRLVCPDCRSVTCASCRQPWEKQHEGMSCDAYAAWLEENNDSEKQLSKHLADHGVTCPSCNNRYSLSKGGCMHLTCPQCKHEFCVGCGKPFFMGNKCQVSEYCAKLGLHAHHPRNCLFYLRDKEPQLLEKLLEDNGIEYNNEAGGKEGSRCSVQLQRETPEGLLDSTCGLNVEKAGLCRKHYVEHLCRVIRQNQLDSLWLLTADDLETLVRRQGLKLPPHPYGTPPILYYNALMEIVQQEIPLE